MSKLMGDPRIDPRLKEYLASVTDPNALPTGPSDALWSGEGLEERDIAIRSEPDDNEIYLRVARPEGDEVLGCVYWIHGGGMAQGSAYDPHHHHHTPPPHSPHPAPRPARPPRGTSFAPR